MRAERHKTTGPRSERSLGTAGEAGSEPQLGVASGARHHTVPDGEPADRSTASAETHYGARPDSVSPTLSYERFPFGYLSLDCIGCIVHVNAAAADLLGDEPGRLIGMPFAKYVAPESRDRFFMHLHTCRNGGRCATRIRVKSGIGGSREIELVSATDRDRGDTLFHILMLDNADRARAAPLPDRRAQGRKARDLAEAVRYLEAQQVQLEVQNEHLRTTQRLLEESRDRYAQLYEFSPVGYASLDEAGNVRVLNLAAAFILGNERERIAGRSLAEYVHEADLPRFYSHLGACSAGSPQVKTELRVKTPAGMRDIELISVTPGDGAFDNVLYRTAMMDVTERKRAVEALRDSEAKLRWLIDHMPAVLWIRNEQGEAQYVSGNVARVLGYADRELQEGGGKFWFEDVHPDDRERVHASFARLFSVENAAGPGAYDIEYRRRTKDGSWVWVVDRSMSVSEENGVRYATGMFWDTTRRKRMQEQLRESEERFRQLAEHINDVFFLSNVDGSQLYYVSPTFEKVWGFSADRLYREPSSWEELVHAADRERVRRATKLRKAGDPYDIEFRIKRPSGAVRWIRMRGYPIRDAYGEVYRVAGIAVDVTSRMEAAESLQRSHQRMRQLALHLQSVREEERKRIAREIHDDLGALLLAVKLDLDVCRKGRGAAGTEDTMEELIGRVDMAIESVRRIATDLRPSILDNVGVLAAVEWQAQEVERRTGIKCEVEAECASDELNVDADCATTIFRLVQEALTNVVRHSGATRVRIGLREQGGDVRLQITDNGSGFEVQAPHFQRWGLVGMAERVGAFHGKFEITRAHPHGTTINVCLPVAPSRKAARRREAHP